MFDFVSALTNSRQVTGVVVDQVLRLLPQEYMRGLNQAFTCLTISMKYSVCFR